MNSAYYFERSVSDGRWHYIRNFRPDFPLNQPARGHEESLLLADARRLHQEKKFTGDGAVWLQDTAPAEELYDLQADPHEVKNRIGSPDSRAVLDRMRGALRSWQVKTRDLGFLPESLQVALAEKAGTAHGIAWNSDSAYRVEELAELATKWERGASALPECLEALASPNPLNRYWAAISLRQLGEIARPAIHSLEAHLSDEVPAVAMASAWALHGLGETDAALPAFRAALNHPNPAVVLEAINYVRLIGPPARALAPQLEPMLRLPSNNALQGYFPTAAQYALRAIDSSREWKAGADKVPIRK
jgi:uncharacterized sulfatase